MVAPDTQTSITVRPGRECRMSEPCSTATVTADDIVDAILKTWPTNEQMTRYVVAFEVRDRAGFQARRALDAVVIDSWPSSGLQIHGLEIKVSASDLRRELQDIEKSGRFHEHLDLFSIAAPKGVVKLDLLPEKWGLYQLTDDGTLKARRKPLALHDTNKRPVDRSFAVAFARALASRGADQRVLRSEYDRGFKAGENAAGTDLRLLRREKERWEESRKRFEESSGLNLDEWRWTGEKIGEAVRFVLDGGLNGVVRGSHGLHDLAKKTQALAEAFDEVREQLGPSVEERAS